MKKIIKCLIVIFCISMFWLATSKNLYAKDEEFNYEYKFDVNNSIISNILPNKSINDFKNNFTYRGELTNITLLNTQGKEVVGTNMNVSVGSTYFRLSIIGDLNCDGYCNIVDLSNLIRHHIGITEYKITDKAIEKSADIDGNNIIDLQDISNMIEFIIKGKLLQTEVPYNARVNLEETSGNIYYNDFKEINVINPSRGRIIVIPENKNIAEARQISRNKIYIEGMSLGTTQITIKCEKTPEAEESQIIYHVNVIKAPARNVMMTEYRESIGYTTEFVNTSRTIEIPLGTDLTIKNNNGITFNLTSLDPEKAEIINSNSYSKVVRGKKAGDVTVKCTCNSNEYYEQDEFNINIRFTN